MNKSPEETMNNYKKDLKNYYEGTKLLYYKKRVKCDTFYKYYLKRKVPIFIPQYSYEDDVVYIHIY